MSRNCLASIFTGHRRDGCRRCPLSAPYESPPRRLCTSASDVLGLLFGVYSQAGGEPVVFLLTTIPDCTHSVLQAFCILRFEGVRSVVGLLPFVLYSDSVWLCSCMRGFSGLERACSVVWHVRVSRGWFVSFFWELCIEFVCVL